MVPRTSNNRRRALRLRSSDPAYHKLNELATLLAWAKNPHMLLAMRQDLPEAERQAVIVDLEDTMAQWIEVGAFAPFMYQLLYEQELLGETEGTSLQS
jgi:hypothetical protein